jgi:hypothetical protein
MHVDEVQIDGGGTEAVVIGKMGNPGKRLIVLEGWRGRGTLNGAWGFLHNAPERFNPGLRCER